VKFSAILLAPLLTLPAVAADDPGRQVLACFAIPPQAANLNDLQIEATVSVDALGRASNIEVTTLVPNTEISKAAVEAFVRAVKRCGPYQAPGGSFVVHFSLDDEPDPAVTVTMPAH